MQIFNEIIRFIQDILSQPAVLIALIALIGLLLQKKPASEVIRGTLKTFLGFIIISAGAGVIVGALTPFGEMFQHAFNVQGVVPNNEAIVALALTEYGSITALIMLFGMIANLILARITPLKYIFLTGHHTLYMACMIGVIMVATGMDNVMAVIIGSISLGLAMVIFPAIVQPFMRKITKDDSVGLGHFSSVGYAASAIVGGIVGKNSRSTEELNFPKSLAFLRDSSISISLTMMVLYVGVALFAGPDYVETTMSGGQNYLVYAIIQSITFAAGVFIILSGVRLVLAEIVPAFKGISERFIPGAKPALDCPVVFPYAPNAVLIGFFSSFVGGIVGLIILTFMGGIIILPGVVPHFFTGATAGVFGNSTGGVRGATIGAFVNGLIITFLPVFLLPVLGNLGFANSTFSDADFGVTGIFLGNVGNIGGPWLVTAAVITIVVGLVASNLLVKKSKTKAEVE
ncbi:PTS system mannitol-specific IIC component [Erysipelotrichaceae bacterium]|nr:PTS system mannitol-specific IIC component [Erysipelotrichaceae bacterium]